MERPVVVVLDDEINILRALKRLLRKEPYELLSAPSSQEAIRFIKERQPALVISDYIMPEVGGLEFLREVRRVSPDSIRIVLSGYADLEAIVKALNNGEIYHYITKPWEDELLKVEIRRCLDQWALLVRQKELDQTMQTYMSSTVEVLASLPQLKDPRMEGMSERVRQLCRSIGVSLSLPPATLRDLEVAAKLHNVGNIGVSSTILNKPGKLSAEERKEVERHVVIPQQTLQPMKIFDEACRIIRHHHEYFDGNGYPDQLKGKAIPLPSRILCAVEAYDAFLSDRPFRKALSVKETLARIKEGSGTLFDPKVVQLLLRHQKSTEFRDQERGRPPDPNPLGAYGLR